MTIPAGDTTTQMIAWMKANLTSGKDINTQFQTALISEFSAPAGSDLGTLLARWDVSSLEPAAGAFREMPVLFQQMVAQRDEAVAQRDLAHGVVDARTQELSDAASRIDALQKMLSEWQLKAYANAEAGQRATEKAHAQTKDIAARAALIAAQKATSERQLSTALTEHENVLAENLLLKKRAPAPEAVWAEYVSEPAPVIAEELPEPPPPPPVVITKRMFRGIPLRRATPVDPDAPKRPAFQPLVFAPKAPPPPEPYPVHAMLNLVEVPTVFAPAPEPVVEVPVVPQEAIADVPAVEPTPEAIEAPQTWRERVGAWFRSWKD